MKKFIFPQDVSFYVSSPVGWILEQVARNTVLSEKIRSFKGTVIKGWTGHFWLEGEHEFLQFALAAGLDPRSSAGFGFIELVRER